MMNKSLRWRGRESSRNRIYGFQRWGQNSRAATKKSRRFRRLLKLITGRRQTEWTGATRCPNEDDASHKRESLTDRKRTIFFRLRLPCRPLAEVGTAGRSYRRPFERKMALCSDRKFRRLRLEKAVRRVLRRALLGHRLSAAVRFPNSSARCARSIPRPTAATDPARSRG